MVSYISRIHSELSTYRIIIASLLLLLSSTSFAQDYKTITAQKGDGIYSVLKQNGLSPREYLDQFVELNKTKLGKDNSLIIGRTY
ncbi:MAG: hypothetical protein Q7J86_15165, partial [Bacteroidota bacterium]|nr:hypothetical protein [Bacteroidota bacterium]